MSHRLTLQSTRRCRTPDSKDIAVSLSQIKAWLTIDYVASNTSVLTLVIICFDRYLSGKFLTSGLNFRFEYLILEIYKSKF